jgi:hypothetical protein
VSVPTRSLIGLLLLGLLAAGGVALLDYGLYGWTIFVLAPLLVGGITSWIIRPTTAHRAVRIGALAVMFASCFLLVAGLEGLICLVMALPLVLPLGAFGAFLVYYVDPASLASRNGLAMLLMLPVASIGWDTQAKPPMYEVHTAIIVAAPPELVWKRVIAFSELPDPQEWYFRAGIAYPLCSQIVGSGVGAVRYCEFSTGPFIEPIEVWDEPHLLRFRVTENPAPMLEWSPYAQVLPKHLHGYMISEQGQFQLTRLPDGRTLLEGTTRYQHGLWPSNYWRWWSDAIIHRIHLRVLNHIRSLAEEDSSVDSVETAH